MPGVVHANTFLDNPHIREFPGYKENSPSPIILKDDGRYEVVVPPGRSLITCQSDVRRYRRGVGAEAIQGYNPVFMYLETLPRPVSTRECHALAAIDLDPKVKSVTVDLQVDPGRSITIHAIDPDGKPIGGTKASGIGDLFSDLEYDQESPTIEIHALDPSRPRHVTITHAGRKLIGSVYLKGNEIGPLTVRLQPWGTITGRVIDDEGKPRVGLQIMNLGPLSTGRFDPVPMSEEGVLSESPQLGRDGRFRIEGLVPGLKYGASASEGYMFQGDVFREVTVTPGEVKDLGDLKLIPPKPNGQE